MSMIGKSLVHYEISAQLGKGGMGEVYQAKDTKLGREVAIKVLPEEFAMDHDRVARFQREAKLLASLNHPNIAAIHGLEESEGTHFLVMELIEGQTLKDRIKTGPIPVEEALKLALQMAEALEAAHEKGVIHRDLKPANIKVTPDGKVKILDFGLAKAYVGDQENISPMDSPTISAAATQQGVILGTAAYMSPEQARGKPVDRRADIWAFGAVLFEMLTGQTAFQGEDVSETLASVIKGDSNLTLLSENIHPRVREVITRCLQKDIRRRYSSIGDARYEIEQALADPSGVIVQPITGLEPRKRGGTALTWVAVVILTAIIVGAVIWNLRAPEPPKIMRFSYELPEGQQFTSDIQLTVSPDGSQFVYLTTDGLYLRSVDALDARLVAGTDQGSRDAVFSPDGRWIAYWSFNDRKLKKIAISGGVPVVLCDTSVFVLGLSWSSDNTIVYTDVVGGGVKRVSADGGTPESLIKAEFANAETDGMPVLPQMLPDRETILFTNLFSATDMSVNQIAIQSIESGVRKVLIGGVGAMYLSTGHLVYAQVNNNVGSLVAVPFDLDTMEVKGGPVPLLENTSAMALSDSGTLVYVSQLPGVSGSSAETGSSSGRKLVWVDRKGQESPIEAPPHIYAYPKISPDGTKVAVTANISNNTDIWIWDLLRKTLTRLTFDPGPDLQPIWTLDGEKVLFNALLVRNGIYWKAANGTGEEEKLVSEPNRALNPFSWSVDGKNLVVSSSADLKFDISMVSMEGERPIIPLLQTEYNEAHPQVSPDGRWLAYCSNESGNVEVYVRPFPDMNAGRWQVSTSGGNSPRWSPDSRELFYLVGETETEAVMVVSVETEPTFKPGTPQILFPARYVGAFPANGIPWDIHPDGKRFLMMKAPESTTETAGEAEAAPAGPRRITIILNWDEELKQRVPVD
jgi:serine/threonine protein kinase